MTTEPEKITIVEGPPPIFEPASDPWVYALNEGPVLRQTARCLLRTLNGPKLIERCRNAWSEQRDVFLDYRENDGLRKEALILAARNDDVPEGQILQLWIQLDAIPEAAVDDGDFDADNDEPMD
ncbi:MAG TPA: hypothetical protein VI547_08520 [Anaerolineales bacterium]|nr:hypothetical protein [Anaerolineales bacterium]